MNSLKLMAAATVAGLGLTTPALAGNVVVNSDIAVSTTWTANNCYDLQDQIYVLPGATLTIEPGTVIASTANVGGSLAITRGAKIVAQGTADDPIIFTTSNDVATWTPDGSHPTGGDPKTGTWREAANEWGNITIMGRALIGACTTGNLPTCDAGNIAPMEGLVAAFAGDPNVEYGGGDDDDDSGTLSYVSLRYGGRVISLTNELNGLSLGGIGRETDIDHVEIMNNVDDGIEIWGGTVNLKNFSIWNIGDDSLDIDQGYRGKVQFGLIVQGYSVDDSQGSGVGDNAIEHDGAEFAFHQPVTTTSMWNMTVIGQPVDGDGLTAWRDGARVQYHNSIFMDCGEKVVRFDDVDGDPCGTGYGSGVPATLSFDDCWTTPYNAVPAHPNDCPPGTYQAQSSGNLIDFEGNVFFRNINASAFSDVPASGLADFNADNVFVASLLDADAPIQSITRGAPVVKGGKTMLQVVGLDPRPANDALTASKVAPTDGTFCPVSYRGAFAPDNNWLGSWTASHAFGFTSNATHDQWQYDYDCASFGEFGWPLLSGTGDLTSGAATTVTLTNVPAGGLCGLFLNASGVIPTTPLSLKGAPLCAYPFLGITFIPAVGGEISIPFAWPAGVPAGFPLGIQYMVPDPQAEFGLGVSSSNQLIAIAQ